MKFCYGNQYGNWIPLVSLWNSIILPDFYYGKRIPLQYQNSIIYLRGMCTSHMLLQCEDYSRERKLRTQMATIQYVCHNDSCVINLAAFLFIYVSIYVTMYVCRQSCNKFHTHVYECILSGRVLAYWYWIYQPYLFQNCIYRCKNTGLLKE